jgi:hypothetical protein
LVRCGPETEEEENATIYFHHKKLMLSKYHLLQKTCCDPIRNHSKNVNFVGLRQLSVGTAKLFIECENKDSSLVKPGQKLCMSYRSKAR